MKPRPPSTRALHKQLQPALILLMVGLIAALVAGSFYPPVDLKALWFVVLPLFLLPLLANIVVLMRNRLAADIGRLRQIHLWAGAILMGTGIVWGVNGLADLTPPRLVHTSISRKHITTPSRGGGRSYIVTLVSWRPGREAEEMFVSAAQYRSLQVGDRVVVEVHAGLFRVPWWGRISVESTGSFH